jgi:hypothetical protein
MALTVSVKETTTVVGTGSLTLLGAVLNSRAFAKVLASGARVLYRIDDGVGAWERGVGTFLAPMTLTREQVISSSNNNQQVSFRAGVKTVSAAVDVTALDQKQR